MLPIRDLPRPMLYAAKPHAAQSIASPLFNEWSRCIARDTTSFICSLRVLSIFDIWRISNHMRIKHLTPSVGSPEPSFELVEDIVESCLDAKGRELCILDMKESFGLSDYFVLVNGRSDRQVQGICNKLISRLESKGISPTTIEGYEDGHWVLVDLGDVIVHIFYEPLRKHYDLESLWNKAQKLQVTEENGEPVLRAA